MSWWRGSAMRRDVRYKARVARQARGALAEFLAANSRLVAPPVAAEVDLSVVIVIWDQPHFVLRCLRALLDQRGPSIQIILVDNDSAAKTTALLDRLDGFTVLRNASNLGFLRACNQGARHARGRSLLLLNSDAFVHEDALANALAVLDSEPNAGAVGGRLILPSGQLQEAGCVVWSDGTTSGLGRGLAPDADIAMVRRDVDYCSGAFLMTPRRLWEELGGFDDAYAPAYYEEADYCMRLRQAGYRVVFEPSVLVDHYEYGSQRKSGDALRISLRNLKIFQERHADSLNSNHASRLDVSNAFLQWRRTDRPSPAALALSDLHRSDPPTVSIIMPTYGQFEYTIRCLASITANPPGVAVEVVVIDDGHRGAEADVLTQIPWVRLIRHEENQGFIAACNTGARASRAEFLCFLNNDTEVAPGWLDALVDTFRLRADVGLVGSRLVYPDGRLQEAGGVIYSDGTGWNCGKFDDPRRHSYRYVREADYCSGASLLIRRRLFEELGGFDPIYAPAYYEDTDLAFRVRRAGLKVLYQPRSVVMHHEGVSNGRDRSSGVKAHQEKNRLTFLARWREELESGRLAPGVAVDLRARDRVGERPVVLVIDHYAPEPDQDAGSNCMVQMIGLLASAGFHIKFWPQNQRYTEAYVTPLEQMGVEVFYGDVAPFRRWLRANRAELDVVIISRPHVAEAFLPAIRRAGLPTIYLGHDLHADRMSAQASLTNDYALAKAARAMRALERRIWRTADLALYFSDEEVERVHALEPRATALKVVPYGFDVFEPRIAAPPGADIVFVAGFGHPPNEDAAEWLVAQILPLIRAEIPSARLHLVGSHPTQRVRALAGEAVIVTGHVSAAELEAHYRSARLALVPLRFGAGVKLKVVEALRLGLPLATTSVGAQGLPHLADVAPVTDDAAQMAAAAIKLIGDDGLWQRQSAAQTAYAEAHFSLEAMKTSYLRALELGGVMARPRAPFAKSSRRLKQATDSSMFTEGLTPWSRR